MTEVGNRYGKLVVIAPAENNGHHKLWYCDCDCGGTARVWQISLRSGRTVSCGCHKRANTKKRWADWQKDGKGFWSRVDKSGGEDACWPWVGLGHGRDETWYGGTSHKGKRLRAHRLAYILTHGEDRLDKDAVLRHMCDNKACCNPKHLVPGTQLENIADMKRSGALKGKQSGSKNSRAKLTYDAAECMRRAYEKGLSQELIGHIFGVSQASVSQVMQFKIYTEPDE